MADDGLLLNFNLPTDAFVAQKTKFTGGSWKDRLAAKKSAQFAESEYTRTARHLSTANSQSSERSLLDEPPLKRVRTESARPASKLPDREFVSSLFTYNPKSTGNQSITQAVEETDFEPSNAPLDHDLANFTSIGLSDTLASHLLRKLNIKAPTAIQRKAIEQLCRNNTDAFIQAETGSGKTLAYLLPVLQRVISVSEKTKETGGEFGRQSGLFAIILAPTRELSKQICSVLETLLTCCHRIVAGAVIGGEKKKSEKARLRKGINILVATPGRLTDHLTNTEVLDVSQVRWLVLDEGDRLMELGFEHDIQKILGQLNLQARKVQPNPVPGLPERRVTILCSATMKSDVEQLQSMTLKEPVSLSVDSDETKADTVMEYQFSAPSQLKQSYAVVPAKQRLVALEALLRQSFKRKGSVMKCMVFMSCADSVDFHFELLRRAAATEDRSEELNEADEKTNGKDSTHPTRTVRNSRIPQGNTISEARTHSAGTTFCSKDNIVHLFRLHGSLQQATRTSTLKAFADCVHPAVLICTDVASRGLDLPSIDFVIEYDPPFSKEDHLHRVGRTARAGRDGRALIFLLPGCEEGYVQLLAEGKPRHFTRHEANELLGKGFSPTSGIVRHSDWEDLATDWQLETERWILASPKRLEQARRAYQSHIRAYATHVSSEREIFNMQELHLGHLAKAFGLRDKPGSIRVPGLRPGKHDGKRARTATQEGQTDHKKGGKSRSAFDTTDGGAQPDIQEGRKKMRAKVMSMGGASEFNLG